MKRRVSPGLQVVTGKGGVGKSTFAAALALGAARAGKRVLAVELGSPAGLARLLGAEPREHGIPIGIEDRLSLAYYDGEASLAEFLRRRVPFAGLLDAAFEHPLYRAFVSAGPGVRELMALGKVRDELLALSGGPPRWDLLVLDAGASGHALQLLGMPAATARAFRWGLAHREASKLARFLGNPAHTAVHVVALPERMPLDEAETVARRLREIGLPLGRLIVNQCRPPAPAGIDAAMVELSRPANDAARAALMAAVVRDLAWLRIQENGIGDLEQRVGRRAERLPRLVSLHFGAAELERLAGVLGGTAA